MSETPEENNKATDIYEKVDYLERRISQLESLLGIRTVSHEEFKAYDRDLTVDELKQRPTSAESESAMESKIGEFGLGWLGSIVLLFGIVFISQYIQSSKQPLLSGIFGYIAALIVFVIAKYINKSIPDLSFKFNLIGYILLFYISLRLHYFTNFPLFSAPVIPLILLLIISVYMFFIAEKKQSEFLASIGIIMLITALNVSHTTHFLFALVTLGVLYTIYLLYKNSWWKLTLISLLLSYVSFVIWYLMHVNTTNVLPKDITDHYSITYLFICVSLFSMITLFKRKESIPDSIVFIAIILNGLFFTLILTMYVVTFYMTNYVGIFISISAICMVFSIVLKKYSELKYSPAFYALYGFIAISTVVYGIFGLPLAYLLLSIQSLLVVSMAIWFRSKLFVMMNFFLFIVLMAAYYFSSASIHSINFSFPLVALISARIINWQSKRLDIKTDLLRNVYLILGFFAMLYALYMIVPKQYITLSWSILAVLYFLISIAIRNIKYRWMAISTMISAGIYLTLVDLASVGIIYRIIAFMSLAIISIAISVYYTKNKKKTTNKELSTE